MNCSAIQTDMETFGASLTSDGWEDANRAPLVGFTLSVPSGSRYLTSIDASGHVKDAAYLAAEAIKMIEEIKPENVSAFITDNASAAVSSGIIVCEKFPHIQRIPCGAHVMDLLLEDICKMDFAKEAIALGSKIVVFIRNHQWSLALLRKQAKKELLYPGATRFATNIIMLTRLVELRDDLEQIVEHATWQGHMPPAKGKAAREAEKVEKAMTKASRSGRVHIPTSKITQLAALARQRRLGPAVRLAKPSWRCKPRRCAI